MRMICMLVLATAGWSLAQDFGGAYEGQAAVGQVEVELHQTGDRLVGTLVGPGIRLELDGWVEDGVGFGLAHTGDGSVGFEAYLAGVTLGLYLFEMDGFGAPIEETVIELILTRTGGQPTAGVGGDDGAPRHGDVATPGIADPFGTQPADPFATQPADPLVGTFSDGRLTLEVRAAGGGYEAEMRTAEQVFPLQLLPGGDGLVGEFVNGGQRYAFEARLEGDTMVFSTSGNVYRLAREIDPFASGGAAAPAPPATVTTAPVPAAARGPAIATGAFATLHEDDALAFIEALEFVLGELGYTQRFTAAERREAITLIAQAFPTADRFDQLVLADARSIWQRVQHNWQRASDRERREFALGVLVLAFGEQTVQAWVGPGGAGGGGRGFDGSCWTFEECTSQFVDPQTWADTQNAQGCWAAAGCDGYDAGTNTFTYNEDY
jgi:hypothetical protein